MKAMKEYSVTAAGHSMTITIHACPLEIVYRSICCWFGPARPVTVTDMETGERATFTRSLDAYGNLVAIVTL